MATKSSAEACPLRGTPGKIRVPRWTPLIVLRAAVPRSAKPGRRIPGAGHLGRGLALLLCGAGCSTQPVEAARTVAVFKCAGELSFTVERDERIALVAYSGVRYELPRRRSSIGSRYASSDATLIIDGDMAAFVSGRAMNLDFCRAGRGATS